MPIECSEGHASTKVVYRRPATMPKQVKWLRAVIVFGVLLTLGNLVNVSTVLFTVSDEYSAPMREEFEAARAEEGGEVLAEITDLIRTFDTLIVLAGVGAFLALFFVVAKYAKLLWKGFGAGDPRAYDAIGAVAKTQLVVLAATVLGPAIVFAGNEVISYNASLGIGMLVPFVVMWFLRRAVVKEYFSVYEVVRGPDMPADLAVGAGSEEGPATA